MSDAISVLAVYENGLLRPLQALSLSEHEQVHILISPEAQHYAAPEHRLLRMHEQVDDWMARQPQDAVRPPRALSPSRRRKLDAELERLLADVDAAMSDSSDGEVAGLVDEAAQVVRASR